MSVLDFTAQQIYDYKIIKSNKIYVQDIFINVIKDLYRNCEETEYGKLSINDFWIKLKDSGCLVQEKNSSCPVDKNISNYTIDYVESNNVYLDIGKCSSIMKILMETDCSKNEHIIKVHENMIKLRDNRNKQEKCKCTEEELKHFKNEIIEGIKEICDDMQKYFYSLCDIRKKYENFRKTHIFRIKKLWKAKIGNDKSELTEILNDINKLREFNIKCKEELLEVYKKLLESSPLLEEKFKFNIKAIFVAPLLKDKNEYISYKDILERKLRKQSADVPVIIISGDAGHGKTTLCKKLTLDWCSQDKCSDFDYDLLLFIEVKRAKEKGICQYLKEILLQDSLLEVNATEEEIISFLQKLKLLIIIDAYDEKSKEANSLINNLFEFIADKKIIITTRPHYKQRITKILQNNYLNYLHLKLDGFEDETEYIEKVWTHLGDQDENFNLEIDNFLDFKKELPEDLKKLLKIPLITFLLIYLWVNSITAGKPIKNLTYTSLYHEIFELQKATIKKKILQNIEEKNSEDVIQEVINNFFCMLSEKSYNLIETKVMSIDCFEEIKSDLIKELKKFHMKEEYNTLFFSTTFMSTRNLRNLKSENILQFEFLHKTQFEYFVACHAANVLKRDASKSINDLEIFSKSNFTDKINEFSFLLGILNEEGILEKFLDDIIKNLKDKVLDDYNIFWKLLSETISKKTESDSEFKPNIKLCRYFRTSLLKDDWRLLDNNVISGMNILRHTSFKPGKLVIEISDNPNTISSFEYSFSMMVKCLNKLKNETKLEIHFNSHKKKSDDKSEDRSSDNILAHLVSESNILSLEKFTGHINEDKSVKVLGASSNLIRIDVRVTSISVLQNIVKACNKSKKKLKWVFFIFDEPFKPSKKEKDLPKLDVGDEKTNICVVYNSVKDVNLAINNLAMMKPENRSFYSVLFELVGDQERSPQDWLVKIQEKNLIGEKLIVRCLSYQMEEEEDEYLKNELLYLLLWNK